MQVPTRRAETYRKPKPDPHITAAKFNELKTKLQKLKEISRPRESAEVKRLALMGDFSENAGYQLAKGRLRGINQAILDIENQLKYAEIIETATDTSRVSLGHLVTVEVNAKIKTYQILGSVETDPTRGIISHNSPLGSALLGKRIGEVIPVRLADKIVDYKIIKIE